MVVKELNPDLINQANNNSMMGKRGEVSEREYKSYVEKILSWPISDEKKQKLLDKLYEKRSEILRYEAQHVSWMVAGPARYNSRKLDKSDRILQLHAEFSDWWGELERQIQNSQIKDDKATSLLRRIEFCRRQDNPCDPTGDLVELAFHDNQAFIRLYEEMYPDYKWRGNSNIAKLYKMSLAGEVKEIRKEVFFEDDNLTAYTEGDRAYIKFILKPKQQLIYAIKKKGYWWNSGKGAWSTYLNRLDKEWVASISERYKAYI